MSSGNDPGRGAGQHLLSEGAAGTGGHPVDGLIRIAHMVDVYHRISETFIRDAARGLSERFGEVSVLCRKELNEEVSSGPRIHQVGDSPFQSLLLGILTTFEKRQGRWTKALQRLRERRLVALYGRAVTQLSSDVLFAEYGPMGRIARQVALATGRPFIVHFHGYDASSRLADADYAAAITPVVRDAACVIVPSHHLRRRLQAHCGVDVGRMEVVPYGPDAQRIEAARTAVAQDRSPGPLVVAVGRLTEKKHPLALIEAFRIVLRTCPEAKLLIVGGGELRDKVERRLEAHGMTQSVTLAGDLPHTEALTAIARAWVFVQHSVTSSRGDQEGMPVSILEAMRLGLPVVSTRHSGIPEAVDHEGSGILVAEHDFEEMAVAIVRLLQDSGERQRMGDTGQCIAEKHFTAETRLNRLETIIRESVRKF